MTNKTTKSHYEKYEDIVQKYRLSSYRVNYSKSELLKAYNLDKYLNSIPLKNWDNTTFGLNIKGSLAEKVCTLKHIAIYHILKLKPQF